MKVLRLLELRKQQERQAQGALYQRLQHLREALDRLQALQGELVQVESSLLQQVRLPAALLQHHACYVDRLQERIREQLGQVEENKKLVQEARAKWEELRREKEKLERLKTKWEERQREREKALAQRFLDEVGTLLFLRGNQC